jgi:hypothetical protein
MRHSAEFIVLGFLIVYTCIGIVFAWRFNRPGPGEFGNVGRRVSDGDPGARTVIYIACTLLGAFSIALGTILFWRQELKDRRSERLSKKI